MVGFVVHGKDYSTRLGARAADLARRVRSVEEGNREVEDGHLRLQPLCKLHSLEAVRGFGDNVKPGSFQE